MMFPYRQHVLNLQRTVYGVSGKKTGQVVQLRVVKESGIKEEIRDTKKDIVTKNEEDGSKIITRIQDAVDSKFEVQKNDGSKSVLFSVDKDGKLEGIFDYDGGTY